MMNSIGKNNVAKILMVEDNPDDVELTIAALNEADLNVELEVVNDGLKALEFLNKEGEFKTAFRPDLILLDLNMPRMNGREVLKKIKTTPDLQRIPTIVLTTSLSEEDISEIYNLHANCYITKPLDMAQFQKVVNTIRDFWFSVVKLPNS